MSLGRADCKTDSAGIGPEIVSSLVSAAVTPTTVSDDRYRGRPQTAASAGLRARRERFPGTGVAAALDVRRARLRILHAAPYLWSGAGRVISDLLRAQRSRHDVRLVTSPAAGDLRNWPSYERAIAAAGIPHDRIDLFHREAATFWPAVVSMRQILDDFKPDVVHTHAGTPTAIATLAIESSSRRSRALVSHFYSWGLGRPQWMNEMDLWAFGRADTVVCSANAYRDVLRSGGVAASNLQVIPWGLQVEPVARCHTSAAGPAKAGHHVPVIGTLGRVERRKGQLDLIAAFARVRDSWPGARLDIVGPVAEPAYAEKIHAAIRRHRLTGAVRMTGHVTDPRRYMAKWKVYVSLSSDEGQGLALLEAMAAGVPVVALKAAGVEDYLTDGRTGLAARTRSPQQVAALIGRILRDAALASTLSTTAQAMVRRRYSWEKTVADIDAIYRQGVRS
jgi:glycosyltransferase involved in cell wall biosynthesis